MSSINFITSGIIKLLSFSISLKEMLIDKVIMDKCIMLPDLNNVSDKGVGVD